MPRPASARMSRWISARAPTSTPRVGSSRISTFGCDCSHRPMTTFCWLPPLSWPTGVSTPGVLIARSRIVRSASALRRRPLISGSIGADDDRIEIGEPDIEGDALRQDQAFGAPLLRHEAEPGLDRRGRALRARRACRSASSRPSPAGRRRTGAAPLRCGRRRRGRRDRAPRPCADRS